MSSKSISIRRLKIEYDRMIKDPQDNIFATPNESNIFEWFYVLIGPQGTPFEGGVYLGRLVFPSDYPNKPPSIYIITPNGRFTVNKRLCFSMSDYHPELWNPLWSVSSILNGLLSFMTSDEKTLGTIESSYNEKIEYAKSSMDFNRENKIFKKYFPDLIEKYNNNNNNNNNNNQTIINTNQEKKKDISINNKQIFKMNQLWILILGILIAIIGFKFVDES